MKKSSLFFVVPLFFLSGIANANILGVRSEKIKGPGEIALSCEDLYNYASTDTKGSESILGIPKSNITEEQLKFIQSTALSCDIQVSEDFYERNGYELLGSPYRAVSDKVIQRAETILKNRRDLLQKTQLDKAEAVRAEDEKMKKKASDEKSQCLSSKGFQLFFAQSSLVNLFDYKKDIKAVQIQEKRIQAQSGVRNLSRDYELGRELIETDENIVAHFENYQNLGGKEKSASTVKRTLANPCVQYGW